MLYHLNSSKYAIAIITILIVSFCTANIKASHATHQEVKHVESQTFISNSAPIPSVERDGFWFPTMVWPVDSIEISSGFGYREAACRLCSSDHRGIDFTPGFGSNIYSVMDGVVIGSGNMDSYGSAVIIEHPNGWRTLYAHMVPGSIAVAVGDSVYQGQTIGLVGDSGVSTGPHLHFEIIIDGVQKNPLPILNDLIKK